MCALHKNSFPMASLSDKESCLVFHLLNRNSRSVVCLPGQEFSFGSFTTRPGFSILLPDRVHQGFTTGPSEQEWVCLVSPNLSIYLFSRVACPSTEALHMGHVPCGSHITLAFILAHHALLNFSGTNAHNTYIHTHTYLHACATKTVCINIHRNTNMHMCVCGEGTNI